MTEGKQQKSLRPASPMQTIRRLFSYFRYYKGLFITSILLTIGGALLQVGANGMLSPIIDSAAKDKDMNLLVRYLLIMGAMVLLLVITQYLGGLLLASLAQRTVHKIREDLFEVLQKLPIQFYDTHAHGDIMSSFTNDINMLNQTLEESLSQVIVAIVTVVGTFIMMLILSPTLTLIVILMLALMFFIIKSVGKKSSTYFRTRQTTIAEMNAYIEEMMSAQRVVKVFNYEDRAVEEFSEKNRRLQKSSAKAATYGVMLMPIMGNLAFVLYALVAIAGGFQVIGGRITIGNIAAFLQYTRTITRPITMVSNQMNMLFAAMAGAERIFKILDQTQENVEGDVRLEEGCEGKKGLCWAVPGEEGKELVSVRGDIRFHNVDFGYTKDRPVLKNISLFAKPGQKIAFVGSTGAGKTTITNLINRFYEIDSGTITVDDIDIRRINKMDLRSIMSVVLQDVHLFEGTIADNIRYGRLDATDEEVIAAAKLANADYFIMQLKDGYNTHLDSDGGSLSQGERQLLSIARAAVADPVILILDEATSSVDTRTEQLIEKGMDQLMQGRTTFVIAHRLSTVRRSNAIIVLEHGEIIERGDHDELMDMKGRYYQLNTGMAELS